MARPYHRESIRRTAPASRSATAGIARFAAIFVGFQTPSRELLSGVTLQGPRSILAATGTDLSGKRPFKIGDKVRVIGIPVITFSPGVKDEMGTRRLFRSMLGKIYTVRGFDEYGHVELRPRRLSYVWTEPEFLKLRARKRQA